MDFLDAQFERLVERVEIRAVLYLTAVRVDYLVMYRVSALDRGDSSRLRQSRFGLLDDASGRVTLLAPTVASVPDLSTTLEVVLFATMTTSVAVLYGRGGFGGVVLVMVVVARVLSVLERRVGGPGGAADVVGLAVVGCGSSCTRVLLLLPLLVPCSVPIRRVALRRPIVPLVTVLLAGRIPVHLLARARPHLLQHLLRLLILRLQMRGQVSRSALLVLVS